MKLLVVLVMSGIFWWPAESSTCCFPARYRALFSEHLRSNKGVSTQNNFKWFVDYERQEFLLNIDPKNKRVMYRAKNHLYTAPMGSKPQCHKWVSKHVDKPKHSMYSMGMAVLFFQCPSPANKMVNTFRNGTHEIWRLSGLSEMGITDINQTMHVHLTQNTMGYTCYPYRHDMNRQRIYFKRVPIPNTDGKSRISRIESGIDYRTWNLKDIVPMLAEDGDLPELKQIRDRLKYCATKDKIRRNNKYAKILQQRANENFRSKWLAANQRMATKYKKMKLEQARKAAEKVRIEKEKKKLARLRIEAAKLHRMRQQKEKERLHHLEQEKLRQQEYEKLEKQRLQKEALEKLVNGQGKEHFRKGGAEATMTGAKRKQFPKKRSSPKNAVTQGPGMSKIAATKTRFSTVHPKLRFKSKEMLEEQVGDDVSKIKGIMEKDYRKLDDLLKKDEAQNKPEEIRFDEEELTDFPEAEEKKYSEDEIQNLKLYDEKLRAEEEAEKEAFVEEAEEEVAAEEAAKKKAASDPSNVLKNFYY